MKTRYPFFVFGLALLQAFAAESDSVQLPDVPYPDGYRQWQHVSSVVLPAKNEAGKTPVMGDAKDAAPHGVIFHVYANEKAQEGYRTGHFPEGAVLTADWFFLEPQGPSLMQGQRKSVDVMVRDSRRVDTGGWAFENFDRDSHTKRNIGANAVKRCFECHRNAKDHEFVFSRLTP